MKYHKYQSFTPDELPNADELCELDLITKLPDGSYLLNNSGFTQLNFNPSNLIDVNGTWIDLSKFGDLRLDLLLQRFPDMKVGSFVVQNGSKYINEVNLIFDETYVGITHKWNCASFLISVGFANKNKRFIDAVYEICRVAKE